jgi:hypothetical protein
MGKRILCLVALALVANTHNSFGQVRSEYFRSLSADLQEPGGLLNQQIKAIPLSVNYPDKLNQLKCALQFL